MSVEIHQPEIKALLEQHLVGEGLETELPNAISAEEGIRRGLHDVAHGRTRPAKELWMSSGRSTVYRVEVTERTLLDLKRFT